MSNVIHEKSCLNTFIGFVILFMIFTFFEDLILSNIYLPLKFGLASQILDFEFTGLKSRGNLAYLSLSKAYL